MTPVFRHALGSDFDRLHPNVAWRYGIDSTSGVAQICTGIYESVYMSSALPPPAVWHYAKRNALPAKTSRMVPFTQGYYCYSDELGRESLAVLRTFQYTTGPRRLNSLLVAGHSGLVDYFGDGPEFLYPIEPSVTPAGELLLESGPMRWLGRGPKVGMRGLFTAQMKYIEGGTRDASASAATRPCATPSSARSCISAGGSRPSTRRARCGTSPTRRGRSTWSIARTDRRRQSVMSWGSVRRRQFVASPR